MARKAILVTILVILLMSVAMTLILILLPLKDFPLQILVVTGEGLQETYGFFNESHTTNTYNYYRDKFWTESTSKWAVSTGYAGISTDSLTKVYGDYSVLFDFNVSLYNSYYFCHRVAYPYGYLAKEGDKWLYFSIMFNTTAEFSELEVRATDWGGSNYFSTKYTDISSYSSNEWIRFRVYMNDMTTYGSPSWSDIYTLQFNVTQSTKVAFKIWMDDIMMTSTYHYNFALKNFKALFKGISLDVKDYDKLPFNLNSYTAVIYLDNRINSTGISIMDQYVNRGGGLILMGLSTLWFGDGTERVSFPLSSSPVDILNTTEAFLDNADKVDSFANHTALKPWINYTIFVQRGYEAYRPIPYLGIAEVYNVSLRTGASCLISESGYIYEAAWQYGTGKVIYFAENLAKRIANGMLEAYNLAHGAFGTIGWGGATGDRLQFLESAINYVSRHPLPKISMVPFAKKGGFVFTIVTVASTKWYSYLNKSCANVLGVYSNDTAFWYTVERMKNQSEETGVVFTLQIATEQLVNELRPGHEEVEFDSKNLNALLAAHQSPNIEIGLYTSNLMTWNVNANSIEESYQNMWQGVLDIRNALNLSDYHPLIWRYPGHVSQGSSMQGVAKAGLYLDVSDRRGSVVVPYLMEVPIWKLQDSGVFVAVIEGGEWSRRREETFFDWYVENDMIYEVVTHDMEIAADPTHAHQYAPSEPTYRAQWNQTPTFLEYVSNQREKTWIVGGVTLAQYFKNWTNADVSITYAPTTNTYTFMFLNAPNGFTVRIPLNGMHISDIVNGPERILKEQGDFAYLAMLNPGPSETVKVTLGNTKYGETLQTIMINSPIAKDDLHLSIITLDL